MTRDLAARQDIATTIHDLLLEKVERGVIPGFLPGLREAMNAAAIWPWPDDISAVARMLDEITDRYTDPLKDWRIT